jgi:hypothetical protein
MEACLNASRDPPASTVLMHTGACVEATQIVVQAGVEIVGFVRESWNFKAGNKDLFRNVRLRTLMIHCSKIHQVAARCAI